MSKTTEAWIHSFETYGKPKLFLSPPKEKEKGTCSICNGTAQDIYSGEDCSECKGKGYVE